MGVFDFFKKKSNNNEIGLENKEDKNDDVKAVGWDAITSEFQRIYPGQDKPKHYATMISYQLGGNDPLQGISIYDAGDSWHFVSYGLSELYDKESTNKEISGYGMEFTFRLKKECYNDEECEIKCVCGILQHLARITFQKGEIFLPYEYVYSGQTMGVDGKGVSKLTGFITIPDSKVQEIDTPNGKVMFVEFIGTTDDELKAVLNKEITVKELYEKLGTDLTDYNRDSVMSREQEKITNKNKNVGSVSSNLDFSNVLNYNDVEEFVKSGQLKWIYILLPIFGGTEERGNQIVITPHAAQEKQLVDEELKTYLKQGKSVKKLNMDFEYKGKSIVPSKIIITAIIDENDYNKVIEVW